MGPRFGEIYKMKHKEGIIKYNKNNAQLIRVQKEILAGNGMISEVLPHSKVLLF